MIIFAAYIDYLCTLDGYQVVFHVSISNHTLTFFDTFIVSAESAAKLETLIHSTSKMNVSGLISCLSPSAYCTNLYNNGLLVLSDHEGNDVFQGSSFTYEGDEKDLNSLVINALQSNVLISELLVDIAIVDSQSKKWLPAGGDHSNSVKPDFFGCHRGMYVGTSDVIPKGFPHPDMISEVMFIVEGKTSEYLTGEEIGIMASYLSNLSPFVKEPRGILFNKNEFVLMYYKNNLPKNGCSRGRWDAAGAMNALQRFFTLDPPPLTKALRSLCKAFEVTVSSGSSFLGKGANGYAFKLETDLVLKISLSGNMATELDTLKKIYQLDNDIIVKPSDSDLIVVDEEANGYMMQEFGTKVDSSKISVANAFNRLADLHCLKAVHGDPRLPNILMFDGTLKWIDPRQSSLSVSSDASFTNDMVILCQSIFPNATVNKDLILEYCGALKLENDDIASRTQAVRSKAQAIRMSMLVVAARFT
jgi:tRNA A-37 threonylcarbamoyl transferase component Bud32